ncbi:MAG TPA: zinc-binding dehydrogenase, partial [Jatrophihabitantaceae bacterium]
GRHAYFYNIWAGRSFGRRRFQARLRDDLSQVLQAMAQGDISAQIATRLPLGQAAEALRLAESGTIAGKIVLVP